MMRAILIWLLVMPTLAGAQTMKPSSGNAYEKHWRAMQACFQLVGDVNADASCVDTAMEHCRNAGVFEACLDSLSQWVAHDTARMQRALGLLPGEGRLRDPACDGTTFAPVELCRAQDATGLLLDLRRQMRAADIDPNALEDPIFHPRPIEDCIANAKSLAQAGHCVGEGALACWHAEEGRGPKDTIRTCLNAELAYWEKRMAESLEQLKEHDSLNDLQNYWNLTRFFKCSFEVKVRGPSSDVMVFWSDCMVQLTGGHVLWLETLAADK